MEACRRAKIKFIAQNNNGHFGNYYKFILISPGVPILEALPKLETKTSPVYDYSIGIPNKVADFHACLPIWYGQDDQVTMKVCKEIHHH